MSELKERYLEVSRRWRSETGLFSNAGSIISHPCYNELIDMGIQIVPFIIEDLKNRNVGWGTFPLLQVLTGEHPVPKEHQGKYDLICEDWINWYNQIYNWKHG